MADANLYSTDGKYSFYQKGKYFYSAETGECAFYQQGDCFYAMKNSETLYYQRDKYLYSMDGTTNITSVKCKHLFQSSKQFCGFRLHDLHTMRRAFPRQMAV